MLLGAFGLGIPSIALTGGHYVAEGLALPGGATIASLIAATLLVEAAAIIRHGTKLASRWQNAVMVALLLILVVVAGSNPAALGPGVPLARRRRTAGDLAGHGAGLLTPAGNCSLPCWRR